VEKDYIFLIVCLPFEEDIEFFVVCQGNSYVTGYGRSRSVRKWNTYCTEFDAAE